MMVALTEKEISYGQIIRTLSNSTHFDKKRRVNEKTKSRWNKEKNE